MILCRILEVFRTICDIKSSESTMHERDRLINKKRINRLKLITQILKCWKGTDLNLMLLYFSWSLSSTEYLMSTLDDVLWINFFVAILNEAFRSPNDKTFFFSFILGCPKDISPIQPSFNPAIPKRPSKVKVLQAF